MTLVRVISVRPFSAVKRKRRIWLRVMMTFALFLFMTSAEQKECVFLHGSGVDMAGPPTPSFTDYWGNLHQMTPQCSNRTFLHLDTVTTRFDNTELLKKVCDYLSPTGDYYVRDRILFTHSMGNIILAEAIREKICDIDAFTTDWYVSGSPTYGSKAANWIDDICENPSKFDDIFRDIAKRFEYCQSTHPEKANAAYVSMMTNEPKLQKSKVPNLADIMRPRIKGAMCGTAAFGLVSIDSIGLEALAAVVNFSEPNDGMVATSFCKAVADAAIEYRRSKGEDVTWKTTPDSPFYLPAVNHADITCRHGNGDWGTDRQPCSWFTFRVADSTGFKIPLPTAKRLILGEGKLKAQEEAAAANNAK